MPRINNSKVACLLFMVSALLLGMSAGAQERDERSTLQEQHQVLRKKVEMLKREQDFLLFQKDMCASDSKYLVLNLAKKSGQLKYKNRVLKGFRFTAEKKMSGHPEPRALILTKKTVGKNKRFVLIFGDDLVLRRSRTVVEGANVPTFLLREKDIQSVFAALEEGARAFIIP